MNARRRDIIAGAAASIISQQALARSRGGIGIVGIGQTFVSVGLDNLNFTPDGINPIDVGNVVVVMSPASPASTATITLGGSDAASFQLTNGGVLPCKVQAKAATGVGSYSITLTGTQGGISNSPFPPSPSPLTLVGSSVGATTSITFANTSGSASPATTPIQTYQVFPRALVPSGSIAVPQIGGSDIPYQADNRIFWDDGSLMGAVYRVLAGSIAGNGTQQITFNVRSGSWVNTSAITTTDITGASDFKVAITNCHTAQVGPAKAGSSGACGFQNVVALTIGGGAITGGTVWGWPTKTGGTFNVTNGSGTGGQVTVSSAGVITGVTPGSGYAFLGTSGSFGASFNAAVSAGTYVKQYAKGPICDAWEVITQWKDATSGTALPHTHATFFVERWKDGSGNFLVFKSICLLGSGLLDTANNLPNYTYDLDWKNGSTVIRGTTNGDHGYTNLLHYSACAMGTFGLDALEDWSANDVALKAIIQQRTPTECDQFKLAGLATPWLAINTSIPTPTVPAYYTYDDSDLGFVYQYQPFGSAGVRSPLGSGGSGHNEAPLWLGNTLHWQNLRAGNTAAAKVWGANNRVAAAHGLGSCQTGAAVLEPATFNLGNVIPAATYSLPGLTPTREAFQITTIPQTGYVNVVINNTGDLFNGLGVYHGAMYAAYPYLFEGSQWLLTIMKRQAFMGLFGEHPAYHRQVTIGSTTYYGLFANETVQHRISAWGMRSLTYASRFMPTAWADGSTNVDQDYCRYVLKNMADYMMALVPFLGSVKVGGSGGTTYTKTIDFTGSGAWPEAFAAGLGFEWTKPFMDDYVMMVLAIASFFWKGTPTGTSLAAWRDYFKIYYVGLWSYAGSHYLSDAYQMTNLLGQPPSQPVRDWTSLGNVASPQAAFFLSHAPGSSGTPYINATFVSGNPTVTLNASCNITATSPLADGSRIKLTTTVSPG